MEKIKVNMNPNPLDVQTIHASQNDGEARQWEFELHNNGELIDTSEVTEQMVFKSYKGGTEQLLPENGSTPTTSPFIGDIRYPQGLLTDQEFTYRQSPTESDGLAKITDIKGNTIVWNQLVPNDVINVIQTTAIDWSTFTSSSFNFSIIQGHKYLFILKGQTVNGGQIGLRDSTAGIVFRPNTGYTILYTANASTYNTTYLQGSWSGGTTNAYLNMFDLTQMGLDSITDPTEFTSLFPLPYYYYNAGTLLSFNGNGIKTVGKNLFDLSQFASGPITFIDDVLTGTGAQFHTAYGTYATAKKLNNPKGSQITISFDAWTDQNVTSSGNGLIITTYHYDGTHEDATISNAIGTPTHFRFQRQDIEKIGLSYGTQGANRWHIKNFQVEFGTAETSYEPYTSSTLSLPISTYFPNGMKSAGIVYDELKPNKAITRVGAVDLGTLTYTRVTNKRYQTTDLADLCKWGAQGTRQLNLLCSKFITGTSTDAGTVYGGDEASRTIYFWTNEDEYQSADAFKLAMSGVYLYYELATPTETSFTTASLVTENAEIPLSNEDGTLIGKCTEELSSQPGFIDAKIKLTDGDGVCYSNKIQLHVERKP